MPRHLSLIPHLPVAELEQRSRTSRDPVERSHWHIVWLAGQGHSGAAVARLPVAWLNQSTGVTSLGVTGGW